MGVTVETLTLWLAGIARPLQRWLGPGSAEQFLSELGLPASEVVTAHPEMVGATAEVVDRVSELAPLVSELADALQSGDAAEISTIVERAAPLTTAFIRSIRSLSTAIDTAAQDAGDSGTAVRRFAAELMERLLGYLLSIHLETATPWAHELAEFVGLIELTDVPELDTTPAHLQRAVRFDRLGPLLNDPFGVVGGVYGWGTDEFDWDLFSRRLFYLLMATSFVSIEDDPEGGPAALRTAPVDIAPTTDSPPRLRAMTRNTVVANSSVARELSAGVSWEASSEGELERATAIEWSPPAAIRVVPPTTEANGRLSIGITLRGPADARMVLLGSVGGTRIEAKSVGASVAADLAWQPGAREAIGDPFISASITGGRFVLDLTDADGFLRSLLPDNDLAVDVDIGLSWSSARGLHLEGAAGLETQVPVDVRLGPVHVVSLAAGIDVSANALTLRALADASARVGPVSVAIDRVGAEMGVTFPAGGGSFGLVDPAVRFEPPNGLGLAVDAGPVTGGGFLSFDPGEQRYSGAVQLDLDGLALNAIGLLTTDLPEDEGAYSLLVLVSAADFAPVNLGFGFTLNGVGGLLGVNRAVDIDELRGRLRGGGLDAIAFPDDPVASAGELVGRLRSTFPPTPGRHLVGPAALIGWGTPVMLTIELITALELPEPLRLVALAQLRARLPSEERTLVRLNMDAIGVLDFGRGRASLDAVLYDSHVVGQSIGGAMALRARWLGRPGFVLAVGGLNPRYEPPADFPELEPLSLTFERSRAELRLEAYFALTSNTAQVGARLTLEVSASRFTLDGMLQFDALFEFAPFRFVVDVAGRVRLRWGSRTLAGVYLEMTLAGPLPLHARGKATFKLGFLSLSASFDRTLDSGEPPAPPAPADPLPELLEALADPRSWSAVPPAAHRSMVSLRAVDGVAAVVHPLGELTVRQRVIPLGVRIERYGQRALAGGPRQVDLTVSLPEQDSVEPRPVSDHFAPAQFFELGDDDKLSAPAFQPLPSGVRLETPDAAFGGQDDRELMTSAPIGHDTRVIDGEGHARAAAAYQASAGTIRAALTRRARTPPGPAQAGGTRYRGPELGLRLRDAVYVVARGEDLRVDSFVASGGSDGLSFTEALQLLRRTEQPDGDSGLQVVARHEAVAAIPGLLPPGASPEEPGIYVERSGYGARIPGGRRVRMTPDSNPLPPTQAPGRRWQWVAPLHAKE